MSPMGEVEKVFPRLWLIGTVISVAAFCVTFPIGFVVGATWKGLKVGFAFGEDDE